MKIRKLISISFSIIFFQSQIFSFSISIPVFSQISFPAGKYDNSSLRTGLPVDATGAKVTLKEQGKEKEQVTKATIGKGTIVVNNKEQTEQDLSGLNREVTKSQQITKDQITAALDADINVDIKLLTSLFDAAYNGDSEKISLVKDYKKAKKEINEIKQKIQEKLKERRRTELEKNLKKIKFSKDKEKQQEIETKAQRNKEIIKLQAANDNKKVIKEYLKKNKLSREVKEQIEKIGATGEYYYGIDKEGKLYAVRTTDTETNTRNNVFLSTDFLYDDITTNKNFLGISIEGSYEQIYTKTLLSARETIGKILKETRGAEIEQAIRNGKEVIKDADNLIKEMAKSSTDKETYKIALNAIKKLPEQIGETLKTLGYNIGDRAYEYRQNPLLLVEDAASIITSYEMYKAGLNHKNIIYGSALIIGGITLDVLSLPTKAGKAIGKTAKATEKLANAGKTTTKAIVPYYPINKGALIGTEKRIVLQPGTIVDRYGDISGKYLSPLGTPLEMRALPHNADLSLYNKFIVMKSIEVEASITAPAFGKIGLGTQYRTSTNINILLEKGIFKKIGD